LILGVDRFMSMARATTNMIANGVATVVLSRWEHELDKGTLQKNLGLSYAVATAPLEPATAHRKSAG
jgi:Na+/H+-dicarboxylate symporter